jgi:hypothetical protein
VNKAHHSHYHQNLPKIQKDPHKVPFQIITQLKKEAPRKIVAVKVVIVAVNFLVMEYPLIEVSQNNYIAKKVSSLRRIVN